MYNTTRGKGIRVMGIPQDGNRKTIRTDFEAKCNHLASDRVPQFVYYNNSTASKIIMHFRQIISILALGLAGAANASVLVQRDNPNDDSFCDSFSVGSRPGGQLTGLFFGALCSGPGRGRHPTDAKLDEFITLGSDSTMHWQYR